MTIQVGTSGWSYGHWHGELYPHGSPPSERLGHYVHRFSTAELNASFYRWPQPASFARWRRVLPDGFALSVKAPRGLTHGRRLYGPEQWLERIARCWHELGERRAVLLVQLPPTLERDDARLAYFLERVPPWIRVAVELRHPSWDTDDVMDLLEHHGAGYCVLSGAGLPCRLRATAPFVYVRLHGPSREHLYAGSYPGADLAWWADRAREWSSQGRDVLLYFNNDGDANAVRNASTLRAMLGDAAR